MNGSETMFIVILKLCSQLKQKIPSVFIAIKAALSTH
jgi:hypothetical protein